MEQSGQPSAQHYEGLGVYPASPTPKALPLGQLSGLRMWDMKTGKLGHKEGIDDGKREG